MVSYELRKDMGILQVLPEPGLQVPVLTGMAGANDALVSRGELTGLMIWAEDFPGWQDFDAFISKVKLIKDHHPALGRIAAVGSERFLEIMPLIADQFAQAEVRHFAPGEEGEAIRWLRG